MILPIIHKVVTIGKFIRSEITKKKLNIFYFIQYIIGWLIQLKMKLEKHSLAMVFMKYSIGAMIEEIAKLTQKIGLNPLRSKKYRIFRAI